METIWDMWDAFLTENPNVTSGYSLYSGKSDVGIGIERGTYKVWSKLTRIQRKEILKTAHDGWNALLELESAGLGASAITVPSVISPCEPIVKTINTNDNSDLIVQSVDINTMPTSYIGAASANNKDQPKVMSNFCHLVAYPIFNGVDISIPRKVVEKVSSRFENTLYGYFIGKRMVFLVVEYYARNNWGKHGLKRIMMNSKGFFFFKFDSQSGSSFARCLIEVNSEADLVKAVTTDIPSLTGEDFTKETICVEYVIQGFFCH
nr:zinc knuckle CX2CX4HX4C [Tanacetum cinerariifolium]